MAHSVFLTFAFLVKRGNKTKITKKTSSQENQYTLDDVCFTFCSLSKDKKKCIKIRKNAEKASSILLKRFTEYELEQAILGTSNLTLENLLKQITSKNKLPYNGQILFCIQRELTNHLINKDVNCC